MCARHFGGMFVALAKGDMKSFRYRATEFVKTAAATAAIVMADIAIVGSLGLAAPLVVGLGGTLGGAVATVMAKVGVIGAHAGHTAMNTPIAKS